MADTARTIARTMNTILKDPFEEWECCWDNNGGGIGKVLGSTMTVCGGGIVMLLGNTVMVGGGGGGSRSCSAISWLF